MKRLDLRIGPWQALALGILGMGLAGAVTLWLQRGQDELAVAEFARGTARVEAQVRQRLLAPVYGLQGAVGMYATHAEVQATALVAWLETQDLARKFPGVRAFGFVPFEAAQGRIQFVVPATGNEDLLARSLAHPDDLQPAVSRAWRSGQATLSTPFAGAQGPEALLLQALPAKSDGAPRGLLVAALHLQTLLAGLDEVRDGQFEFGLSAGRRPLYATDALARPARFASDHPIELAGLGLRLQVRGSASFEQAHRSDMPRLFFLCALAANLLLTTLLILHARGRQRAEVLAARLRQELQGVGMVARGTHNAVCLTDADARLSWANDSFGSLVAQRPTDLPGQLLQELLRQAEPAETLGGLQWSLAQGHVFAGELRLPRAEGDAHWVNLDLQPLHDAGKLSGFALILTDVSRLKRVEGELQRHAQRLQNILEGTAVGTWEWNVATGETVFNERWAEMIGYRLEELGRCNIDTWKRFAHPEDLARSNELLAAHLRGETERYECEARMAHKDGHWVWVLDRGKLFGRTASGEPAWMAGTHTDITDAVTQREDLVRAQQRLALALEGGGLGAWDWDLRSNHVIWDARMYALYGRPPHSVAVSYSSWTTWLHPEDVARATAAVQHALASGESIDMEFRIRWPDGQVRHIRGAGRVQQADDGTAVRLTGVNWDITESRRLAANLAAQHELLRSALEALDEAFVLYDPDDRLVFCNEKYRLTYPEVADLIQPGVRFEDLIRTGAQRGAYAEALGRVEAWVADRLATHRRASSVLIQKRSNGRILRIVERRLPDGHTVGFRIDVTELIRAAIAADMTLATAPISSD